MDYREQLAEYLARLVEDGLLTERQAHDTMSQYDAGELEPFELPLPPEEQIASVTDRDVKRAAVALVALLFGHGGSVADLGSMTHADRLQAIETVQDNFDTVVTGLAKQFKAGALRLVDWQRHMAETVRDYTIQQAQVGSGAELNADDLAMLNETVQTNTAFLSRFADEVAAQPVTKRELTIGRMINRAQAYGTPGRAIAYRASEIVAVGKEELGPGWVIDYITMHDERVCKPCYDAERAGPWLPTDGPMPTEVCEGFYACRCKRVPRFAPDEFAQLGGIGDAQVQPATPGDVYNNLRKRQRSLEKLNTQVSIDRARVAK